MYKYLIKASISIIKINQKKGRGESSMIIIINTKHTNNDTLPYNTTWPSLVEFLYKFCSTHVAFRSFILCFQDGYNKALCNDEL